MGAKKSHTVRCVTPRGLLPEKSWERTNADQRRGQVGGTVFVKNISVCAVAEFGARHYACEHA
jgi:hypothetical protein